MSIPLEPYVEQSKLWPPSGRHILAHSDADTVVVYQAYRPSIGRFAVEHGRFGGDFSFTRMSWLKPNFLWMMFRSGWGTKENQEVTLGLRLRRSFFDALLAAAVPSTYHPAVFATHEDWQRAVASSSVRLQWDPDHDPAGTPLERRAIQLGLRGATLRDMSAQHLLEVIDMSPVVAEQRQHVLARAWAELKTPAERVYTPLDRSILARLGAGG